MNLTEVLTEIYGTGDNTNRYTLLQEDNNNLYYGLISLFIIILLIKLLFGI